ncbi:AAA family ATPase [Bifidobacterium sp.]|jgi:hypothetical protein|uniref:AAA family ATPase n=1 Tax=Bifidobacterium sp. TaxID=41200 RepID=UPI0025BDEEC4|nr:AAA family ATPase [Bifidobacterium sp.]MCH4210056.1 helicase RepA family protein [Bifidobacterium sp.]
MTPILEATTLAAGETREARAFLKRRSFNARELMAQRFPPIQELVPGVIATGLVMLVAAPKIGKSWMCLDLDYQASIGGRAFGCIGISQRPTMYLALEDGPRRLQNRMNKLGITKPPATMQFITTLGEMNLLDTIRMFFTSNTGNNPLIILDTLGKVKGMAARVTGENDFERDYRLMTAFKDAVDEVDGATLLVVHHTRKAFSGDFLDTVSGTNGIAGAADTILKIDRQRNSTDGILQVTSRDAAEGEYAMRFDSDTGLWTLTGGSLSEAADAAREAHQTKNVGDLMGDVIHAVNNHPEGVQAWKVAEEIGDVTPEKVAVYLNRAANSNRLSRPSRGVFAPPEKTVNV